MVNTFWYKGTLGLVAWVLGLSHRLDPGHVVSDCSVAGPTTELALKPQPTDRCVVVSRYRLTENSTA